MMARYFDALLRHAPGFAVFLPAIMAPFILADTYTFPKAVLLRLMLVLIIGAWLGKVVLSGRLIVARIAVHPAIILSVSILVLTTVMSAAPTVSLFGTYLRHEGLLAWLAYIIVFIAAASHIDKQLIERRLKAGLVVAAPIALYALAQFLGWDFVSHAPETDLSRASSTLGNAVYLGSYLVLIIPLALSAALIARSRARFLYGAILVLSVLALVVTYTRAAWLGAGLGVAVFLALQAKALNRKSWSLIFGSLAVALVMVGALFIAKPEKSYVLPRLEASVDLSAGSVAERLGLWRTSLSLVRNRPIFGPGLETYGDLSWPYRPDAHSRPPLADRPHNQLLYLASSLGLIGLAAYIWLLWVVFKRIWRGVRENEEANDRILAAGILAAGVGYIVQEQFSFSQVDTAPLFWMLLGFGVVLGCPKPEFRQFDFRRHTGLLVIAAAALSLSLAVLAIVNLRFLAADYNYARYLSGRDAGAESLSKAVLLSPYQNTYRHALGAYLFEAGAMSNDNALLARAADEFEEALLVNPWDKVVAINLAKTYANMAETDGSYVDRALAAYDRVLEIDPLHTAAHRSLAILYLKSGQSGPAFTHVKKWLSVEPNDGEALFYLASVFEDRNNKGQAIHYYKKAIRAGTPFAEEAAGRLKSLTARGVD